MSDGNGNDENQLIMELGSIPKDITMLKEKLQKMNVMNKTIYLLGLANVGLCFCLCFLL